MGKRTAIALLALGVLVGFFAVVSKTRERSVAVQLARYHAVQRKYDVLRGNCLPTRRNKLTRRWYKFRGRDEVHFLNQRAKLFFTLEELGHVETRTFFVSNRSAFDVLVYVRSKASSAAPTNLLNGLANVWNSSATNLIYVTAPKPDMPLWEGWIREADVRQFRR